MSPITVRGSHQGLLDPLFWGYTMSYPTTQKLTGGLLHNQIQIYSKHYHEHDLIMVPGPSISGEMTLP